MRVRLKRKALSRRLAASRISQNRWAQRLGLGRGHLSLLLNGKRRYPSPATRRKLVKGLGLPFHELFELESSRNGTAEQGLAAAPPRKGTAPMGAFKNDIRQALRILRRDRGFAWLSIAITALGIWSATSIFSVVHQVWLRPLPYSHPEELVHPSEMRKGWDLTSLSPGEFLHLKGEAIFEGLAAYRYSGFTLTGVGEPVVLHGASVTSDLFRLLGVEPILGRTFTAEESTEGRQAVAVIGHGLWRRRFDADPEVLGRTIQLDGRDCVVLGVMPPEFRFPLQGRPKEIWTPLLLGSQERAHNTVLLGRMRPGSKLDQVALRISEALGRIDPLFRHSDGVDVRLTPWHNRIAGDYQTILWVLLAAVGTLLLIACANLANLMLVRSARRQGEMALRMALGARAVRIIRQTLSESLLLALAGGLLGLVLTALTLDLLIAVSPARLPRLDQVTIDPSILCFSALVSLATGVLFGLAPALQATRGDLRRPLLGAANGSARTASARSLRGGFVVAQVALAVVLMAGAGLFLRSLGLLLAVDPGLRTEGVLTFELPLSGLRYREPGTRLGFLQQALEQLEGLPGVQSASLSEGLPLTGGWMTYGFSKAGVAAEAPQHSVGRYTVGPRFFDTLGIPILRGRGVEKADSSESQPVVVINRAMAQGHWTSQEDPLGQQILIENERRPRQIVGIVGDIKRESLDAGRPPEMYLPLTQVGEFHLGYPSFSVRSAGDGMALASAVRQVIRSLDPELPVENVRSLGQIRLDSLAHPRFRSILLGAFAGMALLLSAIGLFGVISYASDQRRREFGLRLALGAQRKDLLTLVLGHGARLLALGLAIGLVGALWLTQFLEGFLFEIRPLDGWTFASVIALMSVVALAACLLPARRASRVDPALSLRCE